LPQPEEGEYYWFDLIGLRVVTVAGEEVGKLVNILETGSNDVYVVEAEAGSFLFPRWKELWFQLMSRLVS